MIYYSDLYEMHFLIPYRFVGTIVKKLAWMGMLWLTFSFIKSLMAEAHCCNDLILVMQWVDGCSKASPISTDPCEVPGAELWLSKLPMRHILLVCAPMIGIGELDLVVMLKTASGGLCDLYGEWFGLEGLAEEDDTSIGGPDTTT
jgi:hypothetical protein